MPCLQPTCFGEVRLPEFKAPAALAQVLPPHSRHSTGHPPSMRMWYPRRGRFLPVLGTQLTLAFEREFFLFRLRSGMMRPPLESMPMPTQEDLLRSLITDVALLRTALIAVLAKSTPEVRQEFARAMNATLDVKEQRPGDPGAELLTRRAP